MIKNKKWLEEFQVNFNETHGDKEKFSADYEMFDDKKLLDKFVTSIIEELNKNMALNIEMKEFINEQIDRVIEGYEITNNQRNYLFNLIENELNSYGPITELMNDKYITTIMINSPFSIYIEVDGNIVEDKTVSFINNEHILKTLERIMTKEGIKFDKDNSIIDVHFQDGIRLNAVLPPLSSTPVVTIKKSKKDVANIETLVGNGTLTPYMARFLEAAVLAKLNILVTGNIDGGKTTLMNILGSFISQSERILTIDDSNELKISHEHVISLEVKDKISNLDVIKNSLKMRPDRLIVSEIKGNEAFEMLNIMNSMDEGVITSINASNPKEALKKLETMIIIEKPNLSSKMVKDYIASSVDVIVHIEKICDGRRKITTISEIGTLFDDELNLKEIFSFTQKDMNENGIVNGEFVLYSYIPDCYKKIKKKRINTIDYIFEEIEKYLNRTKKK